jgi:hypothetical protein
MRSNTNLGKTNTIFGIHFKFDSIFFAALILMTFLLINLPVYAQDDNVGIGTDAPDASALLEMASTSGGLLIPRMTEAQRDAIASPATGLLIWQTSGSAGFYYYDGSKWLPLSTIPGGSDGAVQFNYSNTFGGSSELVWDRSNSRLGVGTDSPGQTLDVEGNLEMANSSGTATFYMYEPTGGSNYTSFSPNSMTANLAYTLPDIAGEENSVLVNNGEGTLRWSPQREFTANLRYNVTTVVNSSTYDVQNDDSHILVVYDGDCTINLPSGPDLDGKAIFIKKLDPDNQDEVTIYADTGETIDGETSFGPISRQYRAVRLIYDGSDWYIMSWYREN